MDATHSKDKINLLKREGKMTIDKLRAAYTNMNEDEDKDDEEDEEEKASSEGDESTGGE